MKLIRSANELGNGSHKVCLAIGVFDGIHLGHQQIIQQTINDARHQGDARAVIVTFDKHPNAVVAPERVPPLIYSLPQKIRAVAALRADVLLEIPFDPEFSQQTGEAFIRSLARALGQIQSICVGADFVFGRKRSGDITLLRKLGAEMHFQVHGLAAVTLDGQTISSTRIRDAIRLGDFAAASRMLGRAYAIAGKVVAGDQLGQKLGFPTANLDTTGMLLPPNGVYAARARFGEQTFNSVLNIGLRPTIQSPTPTPRVEVHLLDFSGDLYGQELEITFAGKLRDEQKFSCVEALRAQIQQDVAAASAAL